jgi:hypothetical protein
MSKTYRDTNARRASDRDQARFLARLEAEAFIAQAEQAPKRVDTDRRAGRIYPSFARKER